MAIRILTSITLLLLTGCTYSVHPLLTERELADDIDLSGKWHLHFPAEKASKENLDTEGDQPDVLLTLEKYDESTYDITLRNGDWLETQRKHNPLFPDTWKLQIGRIDGKLYGQIIPLDNIAGPPLFSGIPVYTFGQIEIEQHRIQFHALQDNNCAALAKRHKLPHVTHSPSEYIDLTIFTGSPESLQQMVKEHGPTIFAGHAAILTRASPDEQKEHSIDGNDRSNKRRTLEHIWESSGDEFSGRAECSPVESSLVAVAKDGSIRICDLNGQVLQTLRHGEE